MFLQVYSINGNKPMEIKFTRVAQNGVKGFKCTLPNIGPTANASEPSGVAFCSPKDSWNPAKGKKVALARALESAKFTKEDRAEIWAAYLVAKELD